MKISSRINLNFISTFIIFILSSGYTLGMISNQSLKNQAFEQLVINNKIQARHVVSFMNMEKELVTVLSTSAVLRNFIKNPYPSQKQQAKIRLDEAVNSVEQIYEISILDKTGQVVVSTDPTLENQDKSTDPYFINAQNSVYIKSPSLSKTFGQITYAVSAPIKDDLSQKTIGVIVARLKIETLNNIVDDYTGLGESGESFLLNADKYFITPSRFLGAEVVLTKKVETQNSSDCFNHDLETEIDHEELTDYIDYRGIPIIGTHTYIPETHWCLISKIDNAEILQPSYRLIKIFAVISITAIVIFIIISFLVSGRIIRPLILLTQKVNEVEKGNLDTQIIINSQDEVGQLSRAFASMISVVKASRQEVDQKVIDQTQEIVAKQKNLEDQQKAVLNILEDVQEEKAKTILLSQDLKKFQLAVDNASDHIVITDPEGIVLYANQAVEKITGFSPQEIIGKKAGSPGLWGGLMEKTFYTHFWQVIKSEKKHFSGELNNQRKNKEKYIAEAHIDPILDAKGEVAFFIGIERDVTRAKEVDRMKTEFISLASHQLRTPLSAMKWFLEMLQNGDAGKLTKEQAEFINNIDQSNERMIALVNGLLNISRIESGRIIVAPQPTDLNQLINGLITELQPQLKEKNQNPIISIHKDLGKINLDPKLIRQVYLNLLTNAIKYSPSDSDISIFISKKDDQVLSQVSDSGLGIPQPEQSKVFTKFFRGENVVKLETDGTGLGLYLVKAIIDSSGGKIWFDSKPNQGTTFWFTIPLKGMQTKKGEVSLDA